MEYFFITGLPRSRTAWLANLFTYKDSFCWHEAIKVCGWNPQNLSRLFASRPERYVGTCCSALPFYADYMPKGSRVALIERNDIAPVIRELSEIFKIDAGQRAEWLVSTFSTFEERFYPYVIQYEELNDEKAVRKLWEYLLPGTLFDAERYRMLADFNIQLTEAGLEKVRSVCQQFSRG